MARAVRARGAAAKQAAPAARGRRAAAENGAEPLTARVQQPTLAEIIAGRLRERILAGEVESTLPRLEDLISEFQVSPPSMREALRILQAEGLATVQRGNVGGAVVHVPRPAKVAYMLGMILQSQGTTLDDVFDGMRLLEPACAAACALRKDRAGTVVAKLTKLLEQSRAALDDPYEFMRLARRFHEELVRGCSNQTITLILGSLESLFSVHVDTLARRPSRLGVYEDRAMRLTMHKEHVAMVDAIRKGDAAAAERLARRHLNDDSRPGTGVIGRRLPVRASILRDV
jgi:DNA-binding FadR family transcriptional regulator